MTRLRHSTSTSTRWTIAEPTFTEREPYEKGFAEVFEREIAPKLEEAEQRRLKRLRQGKLSIVRAAITAMVTAAVTYLLDFEPGAIVIIAIVFGGFGYLWASPSRTEHHEDLRDIIVGPACRFFGDLEYSRYVDDRFDPRRFRDLGVIGPHDRAEYEDLFVGRYRDTGFKMVEGRTESVSSRDPTMFDGLLFEIDVATPFSCRVLIGRDRGRLGNALAAFFKDTFGKETRVTFDHAAFEECYAVYASDADEARRLITPGFCDTMVALAEAHETKSLGAAFVDGVFLLAVPVEGDLFEPGSLHRSVYDCEEDIHKILGEVTIAHRVIDILHGDRPEPPA